MRIPDDEISRRAREEVERLARELAACREYAVERHDRACFTGPVKYGVRWPTSEKEAAVGREHAAEVDDELSGLSVMLGIPGDVMDRAREWARSIPYQEARRIAEECPYLDRFTRFYVEVERPW